MLCDEWTADLPLKDQIHESKEPAFVHDSVRLVYVSESLAELLGYSVQEMEGRLLVSFLSANAFVAMIQAISRNRVARITKKETFDTRPTRIKSKQGKEVCLQAVCSLDIPAGLTPEQKRKMRLTVVESIDIE
ncbi:MAG: PAS domain-containing protein [Pseudomonadota bacterium]|nr:PAS domain-containing protein [Pseudomonadota bacterium]